MNGHRSHGYYHALSLSYRPESSSITRIDTANVIYITRLFLFFFLVCVMQPIGYSILHGVKDLIQTHVNINSSIDYS